MTAANPNTIQVSRAFSVPAERIFDAWIEPTVAGKWLFATPTGQMVRVEIDPRVGGKFTIAERRDGVDVEHQGEYQEIDRPRRLAFTFVVPKYSTVSTKVTIDLVTKGTGCELTLTHEGVLPEWLESGRNGWKMLLDNLAGVVVGVN